jgi:hypothetical protein
MAKSFATAQDAVDYLWSLECDDEEAIDDPQLVVIPPPPDEQSDDEDIDEGRARPSERTVVLDNVAAVIEDVAGRIEMFSAEKEDIISPPAAPCWEKTTPNYSKQPQSLPTTVKQAAVDAASGKNAPELFELFGGKMIEIIAEQTTLYARQKNNHSFEVTEAEIKQMVGIFLFSGYHTLPREQMYWENAVDIGTSIISGTMSRARYHEIKRFLHFNDNANIDKNDRFFKVRPLYEALNDALQQFGIFSHELTIDERMVKYFGRHGCKMYMKGKPVKFGYKLWMLTSFDGFPFHILPYQGSHEKTNEPLSQRVVETLLSAVEDPNRHVIYMDNFFTSHGLFERLGQREFFVTGTVRENRVAKCPLRPSKDMAKLERGASDARFDTTNKIAAVRWHDNRVVTLLTNFEDTRCLTKVERRVKGGRKEVDIPGCVVSYNKFKNGVDLFDGYMSSYFATIQGKKWYWPMFMNALETAVVAGYKLSKLFNPHHEGDLLDFRRRLTVAYLQSKSRHAPRRKLSSIQLSREFLTVATDHVIARNPSGKQRRCQKPDCNKKPITICLKCDVGVCSACFVAFHNM